MRVIYNIPMSNTLAYIETYVSMYKGTVLNMIQNFCFTYVLVYKFKRINVLLKCLLKI